MPKRIVYPLIVRSGSLAILALVAVAVAAGAAPPSTCGGGDDYSRALCAYQRRNFEEAERLFRMLASKEEPSPKAMRAQYFLARTLMKTGRFDEAAAVFVRIYELDKPFYDQWNGDFLLGECRRAQGKT
jgi:TolA-binding protein